MSRVYAVVAGVVISATAIGGAYWYGRTQGTAETTAKYEAARQKTQDAISELGDLTRQQADKIKSLSAARRETLEVIEDEIEQDSDTLRVGISPVGMQRLERAFTSP